MPDFSGLSIGLSSLYAQRRGLEVTGHNIANANTEGYSRQRVRLEGNAGPIEPAIHAKWEGAGNGVTIRDVQRMHDVFLDARALQEHGAESSLRQTQGLLARVELSFAEPSDSGLQAQMADLWAGFDDVANHPDDLAARSQLIERASTLATSLNRTAGQLATQWSNNREQLGALVQEVNATAARVAELNDSIARAINAGLTPNDLADQRDLLVQELGKMAGVTTKPGDTGTVNVFLGGTALVRGDRAESLAVAPAELSFDDVPGTAVTLTWAKDGYPVAGTGGQAGGMLNGLNEVLPRYRDALDGVAANLVGIVNGQHEKGYDENGDAGGPFFASDGTRASTIRVAFTDPAKVAASGTPPETVTNADGSQTTRPTRDGENARFLAELAGRADGPDQTYRKMIVALGVEAQTVNRRVDIQSEITRQVDAAREAESGVNLDEEMTNMLAYQRAYEGSARFITAIDQMLDTLINRTGLVGR
jgi:flagellar hook-associated protein 1 FlgK